MKGNLYIHVCDFNVKDGNVLIFNNAPNESEASNFSVVDLRMYTKGDV